MERLAGLAGLKSGSPQSRIEETSDPNAPTYHFYGQEELEADLFGKDSSTHGARFIKTNDDVLTLQTGDLVFSLISGRRRRSGGPTTASSSPKTTCASLRHPRLMQITSPTCLTRTAAPDTSCSLDGRAQSS